MIEAGAAEQRRYGLLYASTPQQVVGKLEAQRGAAVSTEISEYFDIFILTFPLEN